MVAPAQNPSLVNWGILILLTSCHGSLANRVFGRKRPSSSLVKGESSFCSCLAMLPPRLPCSSESLFPHRAKKLAFRMGRPEVASKLGVVTGQYRRLLSPCIVRAQAQCLISRMGVISSEARVAAKRREVARRLERELREERSASSVDGHLPLVSLKKDQVGQGGDVAMDFRH